FFQNTTNAKLIFVGPGDEYSESVGRRADLSSDLTAFNVTMQGMQVSKADLSNAIRTAAENSGALFLDRHRLLCPEGDCKVISDDLSTLYFSDRHHLTMTSAGLLWDAIASCNVAHCQDVRREIFASF
ncbi:MAG: SGNH hydrolase domain-containing protein, partial [Pseudomonadota bacterium]